MSDDLTISTDIDIVDLTIEAKLTSIMFSIIQHCSDQTFQVCFILLEIEKRRFSVENS